MVIMTMDCSSQCHKKNLDTRRNHPGSFFLPSFFQVMLGMRALAVCLLVATCSVENQLAIDKCQIRRDCGYTVYLGGLLPPTVITRICKRADHVNQNLCQVKPEPWLLWPLAQSWHCNMIGSCGTLKVRKKFKRFTKQWLNLM